MMSFVTLAGAFKDWFLKFNFRKPGSSSFSGASDDMFYFIYILSAIFFVLLMAMMVVFTFKYRKKAGKTPERSAGHNTMLELSWSVIPTILLTWMFFKGFWGYADAIIAPSNAPELLLTAKKWQWTVTYPNGAASDEVTRTRDLDKPENNNSVAESPIFYVPEGEPVKFRMTSEDVIHSFWIPDMRAKFDVFPNRYTNVWFEPQSIKGNMTLKDKNGTVLTKYEDHWVACAEYCGSNHSEMAAVIRVVPPAYYQKWLLDKATPKGELWERGKAYYRIKGCNSCHTVDGTRGTGPTWKNMYGHEVAFTDGTTLSAEKMTGADFANYIRESVYTPAAKIVAGYPNQMQSFQGRITEEELACIIAYMSCKDVTDKPAPQAAEEPKTETPAKK